MEMGHAPSTPPALATSRACSRETKRAEPVSSAMFVCETHELQGADAAIVCLLHVFDSPLEEVSAFD